MEMKCWKCGQEAADGAKFCAACGADLSAAPEEQAPAAPETPAAKEPAAPTPPMPPMAAEPPAPPEPPAPAAPQGGNPSLVLKIFAGVCAAAYAVVALTRIPGLFKGIGAIFSNLFGHGVSVPSILLGLVSILGTVVDVLVIAGYVWMAAAMLLLILKRTPENADGLLALAVGGAAVVVALQLVNLLVSLLFTAVLRLVYHGYGSIIMGNWLGAHIKSILLHLLGGAVAAGGAYLIIRFVMGENPLAGKDFKTLTEEAKAAVGELTHKANEAAREAKAKREAQQAAQAQQTAPAQPAAAAPAARPGAYRLKTNRSLIMYILLNIVTCGIYGWVFIYGLARDVNTACAEDGGHTGGLLKFILLNMITCNIYSWVWYYGLGNRLAANAPRYGLNFQENGTTILLWMLVGVLLCGIGPLVALHIICRNTNAICAAYNARNGV